IDTHSTAARADFRSDYDACTYTRTDVPDDIRDGVHQLMHHYGLRYAALDLLIPPSGPWQLIDLNPAGQYDWLQQQLPDLHITATLARLMAHPEPPAKPARPHPPTARPGIRP
ncbi:hypothetical protein ACWF94_40155, partial [Streptomyces sp. NPDC055078]